LALGGTLSGRPVHFHQKGSGSLRHKLIGRRLRWLRLVERYLVRPMLRAVRCIDHYHV
jgi:hypothetical protein